MRHFFAYHNALKMGYSCTAIPVPQAKTRRAVIGLEGVTVWLIAGEGSTPKVYYLTSCFLIASCQENKYPGSKLPNEVSGEGVLFGKRISLKSFTVLAQLRLATANFVRGFCELHDPKIIADLELLVGEAQLSHPG